MKKITLFILALGLTVGAMAQKSNETFTEMPQKVQLETAKADSYIYPFAPCATIDSARIYTVSAGGYITGHNGYGDQGYAQLYNLTAAQQVKGIAAFMFNGSNRPISTQLPAQLLSSDFNTVLAETTYNPSTISADGQMVEMMFASPVSASNFVAAIQIGAFELDIQGQDTNFNLLVIAQTPIYCASGDNSYSYSPDQGGNFSWVSIQQAYQEDQPFLDIFIFPIVDGSVGLNDVDVNSLSYVYPNPANDQIMLASSYKMEKVEIFNMMGQKVYENKVNGISTQVNVSDFAKGTYMVKMFTEGGLATKKIVVE